MVALLATVVDASGTITTSYSYGPYGATTTGGTASANPSAFTGRELDPTGLYFYRARYYEPGTGRFLSEDPLGLAAGDPNPYRYLRNDPLNGTDPSGLCGDCVIDLAFIGADLVTIATGSRKERDAAWASLGLDVLGLFVPLAFGLGHADDVLRLGDDAAGLLDDVIPSIKPGTSGGATAGKRFPAGVRDEALRENPGQVCVFCHRAGAVELDHAVPRSSGGDATIENAQWACDWCNPSKGARDRPVNPPPDYEGPWPPPWF
jgi:RHS repeat-associated protein